VTYYNVKSKSTNPTAVPPTTSTSTVSGFGLNLEPMFVLSPTDHFGIVLGPVVDIPLSGSSSRELSPSTTPAPPDDKVKFTNYGLTVGILGYF